MVEKVSVKEITIDGPFQTELASEIGNGDTVIEKREVDIDGDGYLDCSYFESPRNFSKWQNEFFRVGLISHLHPYGTCNKPAKGIEFDYIIVKHVDNKPHVLAYFSNEIDAYNLVIGNPVLANEAIQQVNASEIERTDPMPRDSIDPYRLIDDYADRIDDINRPEKGTSKTGYYYGIDITGLVNIPSTFLDMINKRGINGSNCYNSVLMFSGISSTEHYVDEKQFYDMLENSDLFQSAAIPSSGDLVVWYRLEGKKKIPIHSFIDLGYGWIITKNGLSSYRPYQFQRLENARYIFEQVNDRQVMFTSEGRVSPPLLEERYRVVSLFELVNWL